MKKGLSKKQKTTSIFFTEEDSRIEGSTYNISLKRRLTSFIAKYPDLCLQIEEDEDGIESFQICKNNLIFRIVAPATEEQHKKAVERGIKFGFRQKQDDKQNV